MGGNCSQNADDRLSEFEIDNNLAHAYPITGGGPQDDDDGFDEASASPNMRRWRQTFAHPQNQQLYVRVALGLSKVYQDKLLPLEADCAFHDFYSPELPAAYFTCRPMILTIGQYSTGKTTFIRHLLEQDFPGMTIGPEPTTDRFIAVCHGADAKAVPGNALVFDQSLPFTPLSSFGNNFLTKFEGSLLPSGILRGVSFVDTPGILSGEKQRVKRGYDYEKVMSWFAEHADMILLFFDAHKLDISDEFKRCISALPMKGRKIRIILNKADQVTSQQLIRVHGALMWSLGKVLDAPEVARVYLGSFWDEPLRNEEQKPLFDKEAQDLMTHIGELPRDATMTKLSDLSVRARMAKAHALVMDHLYNNMPSLLGRDAKKAELISKLPEVFAEVAKKNKVPEGDFPDVELLKEKLQAYDWNQLKALDQAKMQKLDVLLSKDIPALLRLIPNEAQAQG